MTVFARTSAAIFSRVTSSTPSPTSNSKRLFLPDVGDAVESEARKGADDGLPPADRGFPSWASRQPPHAHCSTAPFAGSTAVPGESIECGPLLQRGLNGLDDLGCIGLGTRAEAGDHLAVGADEELLEVPLHVAGLARGVGGLGERGIQRVAVIAVDVGLLQQGRVTRRSSSRTLRSPRRYRAPAP